MIVEKSIVDRLKTFGLNSYEAKLWTALISRGVASAGELADISNVPRSRSYDVLESLESKGFIAKKSDKPIVYTAIPPADVLERIKQNIKEQTENSMVMLEGLKKDALLKELQTLHQEGIDVIEPTELSGNIKGRENIYHHLAMMIKNATESVHLISTKEGMQRKQEALGELLTQAKKKGVALSFTIPKGVPEKTLKELQRLGTVNFSSTPCRMCIVDNAELLFMLHHDAEVHQNYDSAIWLNTPYLSQAMTALLDQ